jgi:hypothetical protein
LLFTDGAYDVECEGDILSPDWLKDQFKLRANVPIKKAFDEILGCLTKMNRSAEFTDDICMVAMEVARCG